VAAAGPGAAGASAPAVPDGAERLLQQLSHDLMSPYCPGRTIASCPSSQARALEDHILELAQAGQTRAEIEGALVERFGPEIVGYRGRPELLWGAAAVATVSIALVVIAGRRWVAQRARAQRDGVPAAQVPSSAHVRDHERDALEDALDRLDAF
jgi:cytochrome c-type biogenesis protein CcmH/NrfF